MCSGGGSLIVKILFNAPEVIERVPVHRDEVSCWSQAWWSASVAEGLIVLCLFWGRSYLVVRKE